MTTPTLNDEDAIRPIVLQAQIIVGALVAGLLCFSVIASVIDVGPKAGAAPAAPVGGAGVGGEPGAGLSVPILTYAAVAFAVVDLPLSYLIPIFVARQQRRAIAAGKLTTSASSTPDADGSSAAARMKFSALQAAFTQQLIVGAAVNEGAAFFALVAYMLEKKPIALVVAAVLIAGVASRFPTLGRTKQWLEQQDEKLREDQLEAFSAP
jgi:hypothetical protein